MRTRRKLSKEEIAGFERERRINRRSTIVSFLAIIGILLMSLVIIKNTPTPKSALDKADEQRKVPRLSLSAQYYIDEETGLEAIKEQAVDGRTIAFTISSIRPVYVSVAASINDGKPEVLFHRARIPPGPNRLVEKAGEPYLFTLTEDIRSARFCIVDSSDFEKLQKRVSEIVTSWQSIEEAACIKLR